jgi:hypothetical protein
VSSVCFHVGDKTHKAAYHANLRCVSGGAKQVGPIRMSGKFPTLRDCLRELGRRIEQDHDPTCVASAQKLQVAEKDAADASTKRSHDEGAASLNANQVLMLHSRLKIIQARAAEANKTALETETERDELHTQIEEIEEQLQPKRAHSDADAGDAHEICEEVDNERPPPGGNTRAKPSQGASRVSRQSTETSPRSWKDGFLHHARLGLVGCISYWCFGDSALAVFILVVLIKTLGLTELVSDYLSIRKEKEAETNSKIVDLFKDALDEIKHCRNEQQRVEFHIALACVMPAREIQGTNN